RIMRTRPSRAPLRCASGSLLVNGKHTLPPLIQLRHFARRERARPRHPLRSAPNLPEVSAPDAPLLILAIGLHAIPRAQGRSLVGAAQHVEGLSRDAGTILGPAIVGAEEPFRGTERSFGGAECFSRVTRGDQQAARLRRARFVWGCSGPSAFSLIA